MTRTSARRPCFPAGRAGTSSPTSPATPTAAPACSPGRAPAWSRTSTRAWRPAPPRSRPARTVRHAGVGGGELVRALPDVRQEGCGRTARAADARLTEVLVHHVDLDAGFTPGDWPADFTARLLTSVTASFARRADAPDLRLRATDTGQEDGTGGHLVSGPAASLLAWLLGRSPGTDLTGADNIAIPFLY